MLKSSSDLVGSVISEYSTGTPLNDSFGFSPSFPLPSPFCFYTLLRFLDIILIRLKISNSDNEGNEESSNFFVRNEEFGGSRNRAHNIIAADGIHGSIRRNREDSRHKGIKSRLWNNNFSCA